MKHFLSLPTLTLVLIAIGCAEFHQKERNNAAQQYENLKFFIQDTNSLAQLPEATAQPSPWAALFNGTDLTGCKHFEVARMLTEIPIGSEFALELVSPQVGMGGVAERGAVGGSGNVAAGAGKKTLRMKKDGTAVVEVVDDVAVKKKTAVDDMLEEHVGIRDAELCAMIYDLAKEASDADEFAGKLDEKLSDFEFPDDFVLDSYELVCS